MTLSRASRKYVNSMVLLGLLAVGLSYLWPIAVELAAKQSEPPYSIRILSYDPLLIHLEGFISKAERIYLLGLGKSRYERSQTGLGEMHETSEIRTSDTAFLPADDPVVQRIISRASTLQGYTPLENHEQLQLTRYKAGQQYKEHWDHLQDEPVPSNMSQRATTIFAILEASCEECGTRFPLLSVDWSKEDPRWCQYIDCNTNEVTIRPIPGNALFWKNLNVTNNGEYRTLHAGLPPLKGTKVGLNIWTCEKPVTP